MLTRQDSDPEYPVFDDDIFGQDSLRNPLPIYRRLRDAGPVVALNRPDVLAIGRFDDVQAALRAPDILVSGHGIGFNEMANHQTPERGVLTSDGERHRRLRSVLAKPLMPAALKAQRGMLKELISHQVSRLVGGNQFDAMPMLARFLPLNAITALVGLSPRDQPHMLPWASAFFNTLGPDIGDDYASDLELLGQLRDFFGTVDPATFAPDSWAARLFAHVDEGRLTASEARGALRAFVIPSLDTTIFAKGHLLNALATHADQWVLLKQRPDLIPAAVLEGMRFGPVVRAFSRMAADDYARGEVFVPKGRRVMLCFGAANHDERHYFQPDRFDISRQSADHLGWGTGPHMCVGMHLAKMEMEVLLEALVEQVDRIDVDATIYSTNAGLWGPESLPMRLC